MDEQGIMEKGPWMFDQDLLMQKYNGMKPVNSLKFNHMEFYVQLYNLPTGFYSERIM